MPGFFILFTLSLFYCTTLPVSIRDGHPRSAGRDVPAGFREADLKFATTSEKVRFSFFKGSAVILIVLAAYYLSQNTVANDEQPVPGLEDDGQAGYFRVFPYLLMKSGNCTFWRSFLPCSCFASSCQRVLSSCERFTPSF